MKWSYSVLFAEKKDLVDLVFENFGRYYRSSGPAADRYEPSRHRSQSASTHLPHSSFSSAAEASSSNPNPSTADPHSRSQPNFALYDGIRVRGNDEEQMDEESSEDEAGPWPGPQEPFDDGIRVRPVSADAGDAREGEERQVEDQRRSPPLEGAQATDPVAVDVDAGSNECEEPSFFQTLFISS